MRIYWPTRKLRKELREEKERKRRSEWHKRFFLFPKRGNRKYMYWGGTYVRYVYGYDDGQPGKARILLSLSEFTIWKLNNLDADLEKAMRKSHQINEIIPVIIKLLDRVQLANDDN